MKNNFENLHIVLVGTTHPGNIGATARAMKTMGQRNLYLVAPKIFPSAEATARATGADDILAESKVFPNLKAAIADCELVIGTSARKRTIPWPMLYPRDCAEKVYENNSTSIAIVFGRENSGLSNEELELCNYVLQIPTDSEYSSLNLASAVQIVCYEIYLLRMQADNSGIVEKDTKLVCRDKMEQFYTHLEECMIEIGFHDENNPRKLMHRMRRLFNRIQLEESEWSILRGFLSRIQDKSDRLL